MTEEKIKVMIMELLNEVDYDTAKQYDVETAEEPESAEDYLAALVSIVKKHTQPLTTERRLDMDNQTKADLKEVKNFCKQDIVKCNNDCEVCLMDVASRLRNVINSTTEGE